MHKELDYYKIGNEIGFSQDDFKDYWMKLGGCGAVTAMDVAIFLDRKYGELALYPYNAYRVSKEDYVKFSKTMKPYLRPRWTGLDKLKIYIEGIKRFFADRNYVNIEVKGLSGHEEYSLAKKVLKNRIDNNFLVPMLTLRHKNKKFDFYEWHWYNFAGYEEEGDDLYVKAVTYGKYEWLNFKELWDTGFKKKGGMIIINRKEE